MSLSSKIIVALDFETITEAEKLISALSPQACRLKVGITLFTQWGPAGIKTLQNKGFEIFLDLKFHDIPQQVFGACKAAAQLGVWMFNVHALGGLAMLKAAKQGAVEGAHGGKQPLLIGVTLLTSASTQELTQIGIPDSVPQTVQRLAALCFEAGLDGVVCSAQEASLLKNTFGSNFLCVTPGIRLPSDNKQDQQRIMTPQQAVSAGSDYLVIGRSITHANEPLQVLHSINQELQ